MHTEAEIKARRAEIEKELEALDDEEQELGKLTPQMRLAEVLHKMQCHHNHIDMCDWDYDTWPSTRGTYSARRTYLTKATKIMAALPEKDPEEIIAIAEILK